VGETNFLIIRSVVVQGGTRIVAPVGTRTTTGEYKDKQSITYILIKKRISRACRFEKGINRACLHVSGIIN